MARRDGATDGVRSVGRAIDIVFACAHARQGLSVQALQEITKLPRATLYRLLGTLEDKGMIYSYGDPKIVQLGHRVGELVQTGRETSAIIELAREPLGEAWRAIQETVALFIPVSPTHRLCVAELKSPRAVSFSRGTGYLELLHRGASGKVILAFSERYGPPKSLREIVGHELHAPLLKNLLEIRRQGYAITYAELTTGTVAVAAPVLTQDQVAVASISAFASQLHMRGATLERCVESVRLAAQSLTDKFQSAQV